MANHSERKHARLAPSASERWWNCPGSIKASESILEQSSVYADEGTAAHELAQHCITSGFEADRYAGMYVNLDAKPGLKFSELAAPGRSFLIDDEMVDGVQEYLDYCRGIVAKARCRVARGNPIEWTAEQFVDLKWIGVDGLDGGTADFSVYDGETSTLEVVDFKYGRGVFVEPFENKQLLCYALGVARRYSNRGLRQVKLTVVQPRCPSATGSIRTWEADVLDLFDFEDDLRKRALATLEPDAALKPGEWCRFCPVGATCSARRDYALALAQGEFDALGALALTSAPVMSTDQLAVVLRHANEIEDWVRSVKEYAHNEAIHGRMPTGFKLVAKRATRQWQDENAVVPALRKIGLSSMDFMIEKLKSPAQVEPALPGKNKSARAAAIEHLVIKRSSGTVLAPNEDPRPAVQADADEFGVV